MLGLLALGASPSAGCIEFAHGDSKTADDVIETEQEVVRTPTGDRATVSLEGTVLTVRNKPSCSLVEMETVEHTTTREREFDDDEEIPVAVLEALSFAPMVAGVVLLADAPSVYQDDPNQRLYNSTGQDGAIAAGAVLLAVGVAMNIWPTVELIRYAVPDTDSSTSQRQGEILQRNVACTPALRGAGASVSLRYAGGSYTIGSTDAEDRLVVDLKQVLPLSLFQSGQPPVSMNVFVGEQLVGNVGVAAVGLALLDERSKQDDLAWRAAEPVPCREAPTEQTCAGVRRYLASFPQGRHTAEAQSLVARIGQPPGLPPAGHGPVVIAGGPEDELAQRAVAAAQGAAQQAMAALRAKLDQEAAAARARFDAEAQKNEERFEANAKRTAEQSEKKIQRAGREACAATCRKECAADRSCRSRCEEACP